MSSRLEHRLFLFLVVTMVWSVAMRLQLGGVRSEEFKKPITCSYFNGQPILDVELASSPDCFRSVVTQEGPDQLKHNAQVFRSNTCMDFVFIAPYWTVFVLLARVERGRWSNWVIGFISSSTLFDVL